MTTNNWIVHKFGGTSLADAERYRRVAEILREGDRPLQGVVVSAMKGMTDALIRCVTLAAAGERYEDELGQVRELQQGVFNELGLEERSPLERDLEDIAHLLRAARLTGRADRSVLDLVSGFGELWSATVLTGLLDKLGSRARMLDARRVLRVRDTEMGPAVQWEASAEELARELEGFDGEFLVITGFVAGDEQGRPTTLGRNGSDFSAAIFGRLLQAEEVQIWTDVDGVMSADPRLVPDARVIDTLSYNEALELAYFGAKVIHPQTLAPAIAAGIPIIIRNSLRPKAPGSRVGAESADKFRIKGTTAVSGLAMVNLEGAGMIGVPGTARRVFYALQRAGVSVVMISQGSSEHSICFVVQETAVEAAREAVEDEFVDELRRGQIKHVSVCPGVSVLAVVGDAMAGHPGVAGRFFSALAGAGVNVRAIAQGSSERNISAVIDSASEVRAVRAVHGAFYLSPQTLSIGVLGAGHVGSELMRQLKGEQERLAQEFNIDLRVRAVAGSRLMLLADGTLDLDGVEAALERDGEPTDLERLERHVQADHLPHAVIIDCTASEAVAACHAHWLSSGIHVVTPNKKANSASLAAYRELQGARRTGGGGRYLYETTVGAGLPVIQTLRDLRQTGDRIQVIEGIFSGTLAWLLNCFDGSVPFSELVRQAWKKGYTEPDPRDDLSGMDVARKVVILAREMGMELELADLELESLVPEALREGTVEAFLDGLDTLDGEMAFRLERARQGDRVLRFTGRLTREGETRIGLVELSTAHPFAHANLTDNVVQFITDRYCDNPLVVQGPGAGPAVTAAGVFADLLRLSSSLGAAL